MICNECGTENEDGRECCIQCGKSLISIERTATDKKKFINILEIIACVIVGAGVFFPFIKVNIFGEINGKALINGGTGFIIMAFVFVGIICSILNKNIGIVCAGIANLVILFVESHAITAQINSNDAWTAELMKALVQKGSGYYITMFGSIFMILSGIIYMLKRK